MADHYIGLMSGTSLDGIDAVLVCLDNGQLTLIASHSHTLPAPLRAELLALAHGCDNELERMARTDVRLGQVLAEAALSVLDKAGMSPDTVRAIGSHGQTIRHLPDTALPATVQIGDPNTIAEQTGITTVADFRRRDLAAGGQGAPLVPAFHAYQLRHPAHDRVVVNIGGMANITVLPAAATCAVTGFDTGPGNVLMDAWISEHLHQTLDRDGAWAASGQPIPALLDRCLADPYFSLPPPKSTGREYFHLDWLKQQIQTLPHAPDPANVQASLAALTATSIAQAITRHAPAAQEVFVCGGGAHNPLLMQQLAHHLPGRHVAATDEAGLPADWVEAMAFAWLAHQCLSRRPGNLPAVTGARHPVLLGGIYPAH